MVTISIVCLNCYHLCPVLFTFLIFLFWFMCELIVKCEGWFNQTNFHFMLWSVMLYMFQGGDNKLFLSECFVERV